MDSLENKLGDIQKTLNHILIELAKLEVRVDERTFKNYSSKEKEVSNGK